MALSGSTAVQGTPNVDLVFSWTAVQDTAAMTSTVSWLLQLVSNDVGYIEATAGSAYEVVVDGQTFSGTTDISIGTNSTKTLASGEVVLAHNADGTRNFEYTFSQDFYITVGESYIGVVSGSGTGELDPISVTEPEEPEPDEPETEEPADTTPAKRRYSFTLGYLLALCGPVIALPSKQPTAYSYNGVVLPKLPELG